MLFNWKLFPGTNLQDLNLDWIINFVKMIPSRLPKFSDHHTWLVYDYSTNEYIDSGEPTGGAGEPGEPGKSPIIGTNGNWYTWNTETETYTDTGTKAQGVQGEPGAGVASGGVAGNVLIKASGANYDTKWTATPPQMGSFATIETSPATYAHTTGEYIVYNGQLYKVTTAISPNEALVIGTNINTVSGGGLNDLANRNIFLPGDEFTVYFVQCAGFVTANTTNISFTLTTPKSMELISNITALAFTGAIRGASGYVDDTSDSADILEKGYSISYVKRSNNLIHITMTKSTALTNVNNNTPVTVNLNPIRLRFT